MNIHGKAALVTGGASGLGAATVRAIVAAGGRAMILDLNEKAGQALASELGDAARFVRADVSDPGEVEQAVKATTGAFGALHICMNCAGIGDPQRIIGKEGPADLARFTKVIGVNLIGTFNVARVWRRGRFRRTNPMRTASGAKIAIT
jgi:3-hydroxyacyl-CoA dehydrogenase / 3-hydroxy-2-methylbutyryl-CoA dehydrogenase